MRLTTKGRFAVTAMLDLAMHADQHAVKLNAISERQNISLSYLEQLFSKLRRAGLVEYSWSGGGYILGNSGSNTNIAQIIAAAEDSLDATQCSGKANCHNGSPCITHNLWEDLNHTITNYLSKITLQTIIDQQHHASTEQAISFTLTHIH